MSILHIVMFAFEHTATGDQIADVCTRMLALSSACLHPSTRRPYVQNRGGGKENSPEGRQEGITHVFVSEFASENDRWYYLTQDRMYQEFVASLPGIVRMVQIVDFEPGKF